MVKTKQMQAVTLVGFGSSNVLKFSELPIPKPNPEQLLVRVRATALNRADILQRKGLYPAPAGESEILGLELAGEVVAWGSAVQGFEVGQRVFSLVGGGAYAEYALCDAAMAMPIPEHWDFHQAAAVAEVFLTADESLFQLGRLQAGNKVLIHAGGSGVGTAAIQLAKYCGAKVYVTAGSQLKIQKALDLGANVGICYHTQDFVEEIKNLTDGAGVDVVEDFLGASHLARNLSVLKPAGRLVMLALMGGAKTELNLGLVLSRRLQILGCVMRSRSLADKRAMTARFTQRWLPVLAEGKIKPIIDSVFSWRKVREAHEYMEQNQNFGKIVLVVE
jgi:putative PIG3 family NAD(P)H quinone oxidoreductase